MNLTNLKNKDMSTFKKCQVLLLPTNEKAKMWLNKFSNQLHIDTVEKENHENAINQHLYILSDEEIKEGDWYMYCHFGEWIISNSRETLKNETNTLENLNKDDYFKKIIATTDFELRTPDSDMKGLNKWIEENL